MPFIPVIILFYCFYFEEDFVIDQEKDQQVQQIESIIKNGISKQEQRLKFLTPIINPEWFLYNINVHNNVKLATVAEGANPPYVERKTSLIIKGNQEYQVSYGEDKKIQKNIKKEEIFSLKEYSFFIYSDEKQIFPPNTIMKIQHSPSLGTATLKVSISLLSQIIIYFFSLIGWCGLIILSKPIMQFIYFGKKWLIKQ